MEESMVTGKLKDKYPELNILLYICGVFTLAYLLVELVLHRFIYIPVAIAWGVFFLVVAHSQYQKRRRLRRLNQPNKKIVSRNYIHTL
jgi:heme O synthase-like polyprenyltransferase